MLTKQNPTGKGGGGRDAAGDSSDSSITQNPNVANHAVYAGSQIVGRLAGDTFYKRVHSKEHFLFAPPAIAFGLDSLRQVRAAGAQWVEVLDLDTSRIYRASIEAIFAFGRETQRGGFERQIFLVLDRWTVRPAGGPSKPGAPPPEPPEPEAYTLPLFGGLAL